MINIVLIGLMIHYAMFLIFKPKSNILGCGIFAWTGKDVKRFDRSKFNILGIINETRGEHSCGVTAEGHIKVGIDKQKVYRDFIAGYTVPNPKTIPAVIGHTRHATVGAHTLHNAHPFGFDSSKNDSSKYAFVGVHNGSLLNHRDLAKLHNIPLTSGKGSTLRSKIDSEILLEILYRTKNFKVLSQYNGAAALIFQFIDEPEYTYFYHGKSKLYDDSKNAVEERPLYYYKDTKNSLYVSSIKGSLLAIGGDKDTVGEFEHNTVYKVKNGDISKAQKYIISRNTNFQKKWQGNYGHSGYGTGYSNNSQTQKKTSTDTTPSQKSLALGKGETNIYVENLIQDQNSYKGRVYFNKFRYWRNGNRLNGIYTLVPGFGFYFLGTKQKESESTFWNYTNKYFVEGGFYNAKDLDVEDMQKAYIPFKHGDAHNEIGSPIIYYFFDGIMMEHYLDYAMARQRTSVGKGFAIAELSEMAKHPIVDLHYSYRTATHQRIYEDGKLCTGTVCPLESERIYTINNGNLVKMKDIPRKLPISNNLLETVEKEYAKFEAAEKKEKEEFLDNDLVEDSITKVFPPAYEKFTQHKEQLEKYGKNARAIQALGIITTFLNSTYQLLSLEHKE